LGLLLTTVSEKSGDGVLLAKKGAEHVFEDKNYALLFPSRTRVARRFKKIYFAYRLGEFLTNHGYSDLQTAKKQRHALRNSLWLLHLGVTRGAVIPAKCSINSIRSAFDGYDGRGKKAASARACARKLTKVVWQTWREARKVDPEKWTPNNFFKSAFGNRKLLHVAFPKVRQELGRLGDELTGG
jgi:hypothetical protein